MAFGLLLFVLGFFPGGRGGLFFGLGGFVCLFGGF